MKLFAFSTSLLAVGVVAHPSVGMLELPWRFELWGDADLGCSEGQCW